MQTASKNSLWMRFLYSCITEGRVKWVMSVILCLGIFAMAFLQIVLLITLYRELKDDAYEDGNVRAKTSLCYNSICM